jgi:multiple sugar transport system substrate-binding protein
MTSQLHFVGRDFVGFRNALVRQVEAFEERLELNESWLDTEPLYEHLLEGHAGDLALVLTDWLPRLVKDACVVPLNSQLRENPPPGWPDAWSASMRQLQEASDGSVYGLPYHDGPMMFLYRGDLFADPLERESFREACGYPLRPARNWTEFRDMARHFTRPTDGIWGTVLAGYPDGHNNVYDFLLQLWSRGGDLLGPGAEPLFCSREGLSALSFLHDLWHVDNVIDPEAHGWDSVASGEQFAAGRAAMMVNWCGFAALSALPGSPTAGIVRCADVPRHEGPGGRRVSLNSYWVTAIPANSENPDLAYRFMRHLASPEMDRITSEEGGTGTRVSTWRDPGVQALAPYYEVIEAVHEHVQSPPQIIEYPAINLILSAMVDDVITARASPEEALSEAAERVRAIDLDA